VEVRADGQLVILDAGSGIRPLGVELAREFGLQPIHATLLLTHTHWDHIQGFPFFVPAYAARNHLRVLGFESAREGLKATLAAQMQSPYFPVAFQQLSASIAVEELNDLEFHVGEIPVRACFTNHPGVCVGYRLMTRAGSVVFMPDNETGHRHLHLAEGVEEGRLPSTLESSLVDFVRDADVLIVDAQYTAAEYESHLGWGHGSLDAVVQMALAARVGRLVLFHHDPAHDDEFIAKMVADARQWVRDAGATLLVEAAREGEEILLPAPAPFLAGA
jgi:phosphoribosyl 1,2-cyclic phosphodiesterase